MAKQLPQISKKCLECGKLFYRIKNYSSVRFSKRKYCSKICDKINLSESLVRKEAMSKISKSLGLKPPIRKGKAMSEEAKLKISISNKGRKKPQGFSEKISGENHWRWIHDRSLLKDDDKDRGGQLHRNWSLAVKNRDKWTCRIADTNCGGKMVAHHILPWKDFIGLRYEVNNGITLCHFHHPRKRNDEMKLIPTFQELVKVKVK